MIRRLRAYAERRRDEEAAARAEALCLLRLSDVAVTRAMAVSRERTAVTEPELRHARRVKELVERCLARPDTATRWADVSGRWNGSPAQRLAAMRQPGWIIALLNLTGAGPKAASQRGTPRH